MLGFGGKILRCLNATVSLIYHNVGGGGTCHKQKLVCTASERDSAWPNSLITKNKHSCLFKHLYACWYTTYMYDAQPRVHTKYLKM